MPVRASITPLTEPGHALLRVSELDAVPDGLTISIQRQQTPFRTQHLEYCARMPAATKGAVYVNAGRFDRKRFDRFPQ